jgi:membrane protein DedA with SNARE-associated domain
MNGLPHGPSCALIASVLEWIGDLIAGGGVWGVFALMAIENVVLPVPSELIMPMAGYVASRGPLTMWGVIVFGSLGGTLGALPVYYAARFLGRDRGREWIERHGHWLLITRRQIDSASERFDKRGPLAVVLSQLLPAVRGLIAIPAGFSRMNVFLFLATDFAGTVVWCVVLAYLGKILGRSFPKIDALLGPTGWALLIAVAIAIVAWMIWRRRTWNKR